MTPQQYGANGAGALEDPCAHGGAPGMLDASFNEGCIFQFCQQNYAY